MEKLIGTGMMVTCVRAAIAGMEERGQRRETLRHWSVSLMSGCTLVVEVEGEKERRLADNI